MKATFVAPDIVVLAQVLASSSSKEELIEGVKELTDSKDYEEKIKNIVSNPANLRYGWIRFEKNEEGLDLFTALLLLSANSNYSAVLKDVLFTAESAFVNINLLNSFKKVSKDAEGIDIDLSTRIDKDKIIALSERMFDAPQFMELYSGEEGPELFMLSGSMSVDTWNMLSTIGIVASRNFAKVTGDGKEKIPGFCILFGLSMTTLMHIVSNASRLPTHIAEDVNSFPRANKAEVEQDETD